MTCFKRTSYDWYNKPYNTHVKISIFPFTENSIIYYRIVASGNDDSVMALEGEQVQIEQVFNLIIEMNDVTFYRLKELGFTFE